MAASSTIQRRLAGRRTTVYPAAFAAGLEGRIKRALGDAGGLTQFGVNLTTLEPGAISALRHWHSARGRVRLRAERRADADHRRGRRAAGSGHGGNFPGRRAQRASARQSQQQARRRISRSAPAPPTTMITYPDVDLRLRETRRPARRSCANPASRTNERYRRRAAQGAHPPLPLDAEALRRLELPASADLLGVRARGDRQERRLARACG